MNASALWLGLHSNPSAALRAANGLATIVLPGRRASQPLRNRTPCGAARAGTLGRFPVTDPALALRRERVQMLVGVTVPALVSAIAERFLVGAARVGGIISAVSHPNAPPPNTSFERTRKGRARYARLLLFSASRALPLRAAQVKR